MNGDFAIFYQTCDEFSDLWEPFCDFFIKYWPDYSGKIYVNSEEKDFSYPGLNIINLKVGSTKKFSARAIAGLKKVKESNILLMMDDLLLMGPVDEVALSEYYNYFVSADLDSLVFRIFPSYEARIPVNVRNTHIVIPPSTDMFSAQLAFWKKDSFMKLLNPDDGPWESEWFGSMRANLSHIKLACTDENVIPTLPSGGLHRGKWVKEMVDFLATENYSKINFNDRGFYAPKKATFNERIRFKIRCYVGKSRKDIIKMICKNRRYYWNR
jgi:hypothetical protein